MKTIIISILLIILSVYVFEPKQQNKMYEHPYYQGEAWSKEALDYNLKLLNK